MSRLSRRAPHATPVAGRGASAGPRGAPCTGHAASLAGEAAPLAGNTVVRRAAGAVTGRWAPAAVLTAVLGAAAYVAAVDPNHPGHYPTCPFLALTGYYCPGCGGLRMVHALAHGHVAEAFGHNPLAFVALPYLAYLWAVWAVAAWRGRPPRAALPGPVTATAFIVAIALFWVLRNVPFGHVLAP